MRACRGTFRLTRLFLLEAAGKAEDMSREASTVDNRFLLLTFPSIIADLLRNIVETTAGDMLGTSDLDSLCVILFLKAVSKYPAV